MHKRFVAFAAMCLMGTVVFPQQRRSVTRIDVADNMPQQEQGRVLFDKVKTRHVIIRGGLGSGSGSFIKMNDGVWLVTNEHVTRIGHPLVAITVEGRRIKFSEKTKFQVAKNRDIARLKMPDDTYALNISPKVPILGTRVWVFGNSAGGNVLTYLEGSINGVGAYEVEVDAQFVGGNSGSPILDDNGDVIGLATYATLRKDPSDWVKEGTRFNDVRRYAVTFNSVEWENVDWIRYSHQAFLLDACKQYRSFLIPICFKNKDLVTDYDVKESALASKNRMLGRALSKLMAQDKKLIEARKAYEDILHKRKTMRPGSISYPSKESVDMKKNMFNREMLKCYYERNCALRAGRDLLAKVDWCTSRFRDTAEELHEGFDFCVRTYNEINEDRLNEYKQEFSKGRLVLE